MGTQQLLTIAGIVIFTFATFSFNNSSINQSSSSDFNEAIIVATGLGHGLIAEIHSKAFDEETILSAVDTVIDLSSSYSLGYDTGEGLNNEHGYAKTHGYDASTTFDDIDDYNSFSRDYPDKLLDNFNTEVKVYYVDPSNPSVKSYTRTFAKRVDVFVSNPYLSIEENGLMDTLKFSAIISY